MTHSNPLSRVISVGPDADSTRATIGGSYAMLHGFDTIVLTEYGEGNSAALSLSFCNGPAAKSSTVRVNLSTPAELEALLSAVDSLSDAMMRILADRDAQGSLSD